MRKIKFRGFDESDGSGMYNNIPAEEMIKGGITVMQFTGIYDFLGVEIYEGDIVKYTNEETEQVFIDTVEYNADMTCFILSKQDMDHFLTNLESRTLGYIYDRSSSFEVIGNIYQNPKLLNK